MYEVHSRQKLAAPHIPERLLLLKRKNVNQNQLNLLIVTEALQFKSKLQNYLGFIPDPTLTTVGAT